MRTQATAPAKTEANGDGPLRGLRVLEVTNRLPGSYCARLLGDVGADVIKVEPLLGDQLRREVVAITDPRSFSHSPLFMYCNLNKRGVTLNLESPTGRDLLTELARACDCVIVDDSEGHGAMVDRNALAALEPRPVVVSVTPFGSSGPHSGFLMEELNVYHSGGDGYLMPAGLAWEMAPEREPLRAGDYLASYQSGLTAAVGALAALFCLDSGGPAQDVDISEQESQLSLNRHPISKFTNEGVVESRATRAFSFGGVVPCSDGYAEILTLQEREWLALKSAMGDPEWMTAEIFADPLQRGYHGDALNSALREWTGQFTREALVSLGREHGLPVSAYYSPSEVLALEHEKARGFFIEDALCDGRAIVYPSLPWRSDLFRWSLRRRPPEPGEHNVEIYTELLGRDLDDLALMRRAGVI